MLFHDALDNRHPQTDAKRFGAEQRLEDLLYRVSGDAAARIADPNLQPIF